MAQGGSVSLGMGITAGQNGGLTNAGVYYGDASGLTNYLIGEMSIPLAHSQSLNVQSGVPTNITTFFRYYTNGFTATASTGRLTNLVAGTYTMSASATIESLGGNAQIALLIYTNSIQAGAESVVIDTQTDPGFYYALAVAPQTFFLPVNTRIELKVDGGGTGAIGVKTAVLHVEKK